MRQDAEFIDGFVEDFGSDFLLIFICAKGR